MPTLVQLFTDPISLAFFALYGVLWGLEAIFPARKLPVIVGHRMRGLGALIAYFLVSSYLPYALAPYLEPLRLADLSGLGPWGGGLCLLLVYQALVYAWHRTMHASGWLFRSVHQLHHSAERLDVPSAFLFSPLDIVGWTVVSTVALSLVGVSAEATVVFILAGSFLSTFQHANLRTPRFLGYLIQRPESHSHHHERGVHANNYADLPIFDLLFGTFRNPATFAPQTGYYPGASGRVGEMLMLRDVTTPKKALASRTRASERPTDGAFQSAETPAVLGGGQTH